MSANKLAKLQNKQQKFFDQRTALNKKIEKATGEKKEKLEAEKFKLNGKIRMNTRAMNTLKRKM